MNLKTAWIWGLVSAVLAAGALAAPAASAETLRICSDPDNLPYSKAEGAEHGLYVDLANLVAQKLGAQPRYVWWLSMNQRKALRNTILAGKCDAYFALPADKDYGTRGMKRTQAFLDVAYAVVAPPSFSFSRLADLKGKRIGVGFASTPQIVLAAQGGYTTVTYRTDAEILAALDKGEIDVAFMWGPAAGYDNLTRYHGRWRVTPVAGEHMDHQVAVAVPAKDAALLARIDAALTELRPQITALADKYGFPQGQPVAVGMAQVQAGPADVALVPTAAGGTPYGQPSPYRMMAVAAADPAAAGRELFNSTCSHCHSPNGASPIRARDLRRLKGKYGDDWLKEAKQTIEEGRPDAGMPTWGGTLKEDQINDILAFFKTIQNN
ncbi:c-type cytochrome [Comamonas badia]|uniref:c-type cytochrome n=1 Tax=Comamonas badia TaxID=265291 RepID=UPI0003F60F8E|nr:transporter substrate-binding domain-containing protein [Comamonas badia]